jgi:hypothetical protein
VTDTAFLEKLQDVIRQRLADAPEGSYTAKLASQGMLKVAQKLGEEGVELALAAAAQDRARRRSSPRSAPPAGTRAPSWPISGTRASVPASSPKASPRSGDSRSS